MTCTTDGDLAAGVEVGYKGFESEAALTRHDLTAYACIWHMAYVILWIRV